MKQVQCAKAIGLEGLEVIEVPFPPAPKAAQVTVEVHIGGINFFDLYTCLGLNPWTKYPSPLGLEAAGVVLNAGKDSHYKEGDRVVVHCPMGGAFSEQVTVSDDCVQPIPDDVSLSDAAALTVSYLTAYFALHHASNLKENDRIFVHSAAGSVGMAATQLAKLVPGCKVIGTASQHKLNHIEKNGVDNAISHDQDYLSEVQSLYPEGVAVVLDCMAGKHFSNSQQMLAPFGKVVLIGAKDMVGPEGGVQEVTTESVAPYALIMNNAGVTGLHLNNLKTKAPAVFRDGWQHVMSLLKESKVQPVIHGSFPLNDVKEALEQLLHRKNIGKVLINIK